MRYFDAHCHIQFDAYDTDRTTLFERMQKEEIGGIVVGVDKASSESAVALVEYQLGFYASVGLHPNDTPEEVFDRGVFSALARDLKVVAIGECGLDYFRPIDTSDSVKKKQWEVFGEHIQIAVETQKPLMIHARPSKGTMDAYTDVIEILKSAKKEHGDYLSANIHFFVGGVEEARKLFELGCTVSYTAVITFARDYDEVIKFAPLTNLLTETDSPFIAPASRRGQRNDPLSIPEIVAKIAEIRGVGVETVRTAVLGNAKHTFKLK